MYPTHLPTFLSTLSNILHLDCIHACMLVLPPPRKMVLLAPGWEGASAGVIWRVATP